MDPSLTRHLIIIAALAVTCHVVYNRLEPRQLQFHLILLIVIPLSTTPFLQPFFLSVTSAALVAWSTYLTALVVSTVIYRLSPFHPLAEYPGPIICKISKVWFAVIALGGKQHIYYSDLHRRYGDIVRIGPNELSFSTPDVIAPMMGSGGMAKASFWDGQFSHQKQFRSLVGLRNPLEHARLRRRWSRGFTPEALRLYHPLVHGRVTQLLDHLAQRVGERVDLAKWINWFSYDLMNDMAFGSGAELMRNEDAGGLWNLMEDSQPSGMVAGHLPWLADLSLWIPGVIQKLSDFRLYSQERVMKRYAEGSPYKDLFHYLMDEDGLEPDKPDTCQVASDASLAIVAGSDTISTALSCIFWFLASNPVVYSRLQAEIDEARPAVEDVVAQAELPYLNAVINETLRIFPPVLSGSPRAPMIGGGGHMIGTHLIPEGTTVILHTYTLHRDRRNFSPLPEKFLPERWLPMERQIHLERNLFQDREQVVHNVAAFLPFSHGPADCIGKRLAIQEIRMVVCAVLQSFQLRFAEGYDSGNWERDMCDYFVVKKGKLPVVLLGPRPEVK